MKNFAAHFASVATLALAVLPVAALSTVAHAAPIVRIQVADLDLSSVEGVAALNNRVAAAAARFCGDEKSLRQQEVCKAGVRTEVQEKLAQRQVQLASVR